jgi:hypothetical protein
MKSGTTSKILENRTVHDVDETGETTVEIRRINAEHVRSCPLPYLQQSGYFKIPVGELDSDWFTLFSKDPDGPRFFGLEGIVVKRNLIGLTRGIVQEAEEKSEQPGAAVPARRACSWSTVGAVTLDSAGNLAAGTSTGGMCRAIGRGWLE